MDIHTPYPSAPATGTIRSVLAGTWNIARGQYHHLLAAWVVAGVLSVGLVLAGAADENPDTQGTIAAVALSLVSVVTAVYAVAASLHHLSDRPEHGALTPLSLWRALVVTVVLGVVLFVLGILVIPALIAVIYWVFAIQAVLADGVWFSALKRSWHLVKGRWWRTLWVLLVSGVVAMLVFTLPVVVIMALAALAGLEDPAYATANEVLSSVSVLGSTIAYSAITTVLFAIRRNEAAAETEAGHAA